jgi:ABC-type glycerol-3-phosphate transport system substrate-binding protein
MVSTFAFNFDLHRYTKVKVASESVAAVEEAHEDVTVAKTALETALGLDTRTTAAAAAAAGGGPAAAAADDKDLSVSKAKADSDFIDALSIAKETAGGARRSMPVTSFVVSFVTSFVRHVIRPRHLFFQN